MLTESSLAEMVTMGAGIAAACLMAVFSSLDSLVCKDAMLASNTSCLDLNELARATRYPKRVIGLHFFAPAHIMKLQELVITDNVSPAVVATMQREGQAVVDAGIVQNIDAVDVVMVNGYGFPRWRGRPLYRHNAAACKGAGS
jgi:3-hydroxyacyl-CoA dehydrogenase